MREKKLLLVTLAIGLLAGLLPSAAMAAPAPSSPSQDDECTHPMALLLSEWMEDASCAEIMALHDEGVGFGVIMKAHFLGEMFGLNWRDLVDRHMSEEGLGWGQIMKAHALADALGVSADDLLAQRAEGKGWGEILQEYRTGPGKPPWAGQGKPPWAGQGKPPWAQGRGKPEWAGPPEPVD
jgi:hypothetical protein